MKKIDEYPALFQFLGGYFHQDWDVDYGVPEGVIAAFKKEASTESIRSTCDELDRAMLLIRQGAEDPQRLLDELGCSYDPAADGLTVLDWLEQVRKKLECQ